MKESDQSLLKSQIQKGDYHDWALLALGFTGPEPTLAEQLGIELDDRSNINADTNHIKLISTHFCGR